MLKNYILVTYKVLLRRKFFTFISLAGISLTLMIIVITAAFFDTMFGAVPPEKHADRTLSVFRVELWNTSEGWGRFAGPGYHFLVESVDIYTLPGINYASVFSHPERIETTYQDHVITAKMKFTDSNFWKILDFKFIEGAPYFDRDVENGEFVAVINRLVRKKIFGSGMAIGETITIDGQRYKVAGVVEDVSAIREIPFSEIWTPYTTMKAGDTFSDGLLGSFTGIVLAKNRRSIKLIQDEYAKRVELLPVKGDFDTIVSTIMSYHEYQSRKYAGQSARYPFLKVMVSIVGVMLLFMILPTVNMVNINLSRIMERSPEIGIRKTFGASSHELAGQFLVENILVTFLGGSIGLIFSIAVIACFNAVQIIQYTTLSVNYRIFMYAFAITLVFGIVSGVYPAWKMSRLQPVTALQE